MKKVDKNFLLRFFKELDVLLKAEDTLYSISAVHSPKNDRVLIDLPNIFDIVYREFVGDNQDATYDSFGSPAMPEGKPVAWYKTEYTYKNDNSKHLKGPMINGNRFTGYIPDAINNVIASYRYTPSQKVRLLEIMFKDLKTIRANFLRQRKRLLKKNKTESGARA